MTKKLNLVSRMKEFGNARKNDSSKFEFENNLPQKC